MRSHPPHPLQPIPPTANQQHPNSPQFPKITALLVQEHAGISNAAQPDAPVMDMLTGHVLAAGVGGDGVGEDGVGGDGVGGDGAQQGAAQQQQVAQEKQLVQGEQQQIQVEQEDCTPPRAAYVNDALCDLSFRVSSGAFFQVCLFIDTIVCDVCVLATLYVMCV